MKLKTKKIVLSVLMIVLTMIAFVGCDEVSLLNRLDDATKGIDTVSSPYSDVNLDDNLIPLALSEDTISVKTLSEDLPLVTFNTLRSDLLNVHMQILETRESLVALRTSIAEKVSYLKDNEYILLEEDKVIIRRDIESLRQMRTDLWDTRGEAYQRIYDLRGQYTRENLDMINETFSEVLTVLETRLDILQEAVIVMQNIDNLLSEYMEN